MGSSQTMQRICGDFFGGILQRRGYNYSSINDCALGWQVYQLQTELQKSQKEMEFQRQHSLRCVSLAEPPQLQEEVRRLRCQLVKAEKLDPVRANLLILLYYIE